MRKYAQPEFTNQKDVKKCFMAVIDMRPLEFPLHPVLVNIYLHHFNHVFYQPF